jgi:peptidoglycan hydrolase CwlO-like protein
VYVKNNTTNDDQIKELKKENHDLQQEIKKKDKEIAHLHGIIDNLKGIGFFS